MNISGDILTIEQIHTFTGTILLNNDVLVWVAPAFIKSKKKMTW